MKRNIIVGQSGGPTAVINSSLCGVITEGLNREEIGQVYGMINGIEGFLSGQVMDMMPLKASGELELMKTTPGSYLGSCRYKLPEDLTDPVYDELFRRFEELEIGCFFYIGGNDSMDTVSKLSQSAQTRNSEIRFIGVPKTIDNDLVETDHTPGFGSAAKYVATTVREIAVDAAVYGNKKSVTIVEIMGRHAGWLTAASILARKFPEDNPRLIYLPESAFDPAAFLSRIEELLPSVPNLVICISEGIQDKNGTFICEYGSEADTDTFGHKMLSGSGKYLEHLVRITLGIKVRSVELNVSQRCSSSMLSATDLDEAAASGSYAVQTALAGETGKMVTFLRQSDAPYQLSFGLADVNRICNQEKKLPQEWICSNGSDLTEDFITYARPLIQGTVCVPMEDGLPAFAYRKPARS